MKRSIIHCAILLTLLGGLQTASSAPGKASNTEAPIRELPADSLRRICEGKLPIYAAAGQLWLEIPKQEVRLTVQIDRGAGMRNRPLRCLSAFRLAADPQTATVRIVPGDSLSMQDLGQAVLPLLRIAGTERLLAGIDPGLYESGIWYDCSGSILRQRRPGHERLLGVEPTTDGCLVRIGVWYDVEAPDRSTEIQMQSGALPLEIEIRLATGPCETAYPRELVVASDLPAADVRALNEAVKCYNRTHRNEPLQTVTGEEVLSLTTPYGISFDAAEERISTCVRREKEQGTDFVRINLGSATWERVALIHTLDGSGSYRTLRRSLSDAAVRRHACLRDSLVRALVQAFDPAPAVTSRPQSEKELARKLRNATRQFARWDRFMQQDAARLATDESAEAVETIYRTMLDRSQRLYTQLAGLARGTSLEGEILGWVARGLMADEQGRFAAQLLRENTLTISRREAARRAVSVWKQVLVQTRPEAQAGIEELFDGTLSEAGRAAFCMQDAFVEALLSLLPDHPQYRPTAEALETLYARIAGEADAETALFARIELQRLNPKQ